MNTTFITTTPLESDKRGHFIVIPISIAFAILSVFISTFILLLIACHRRTHTINHLLIANTCFWSIFYCAAQSNHYIYLLFIQSDTSDVSCRWRAYFAYVTIVGIVYSYLIQAISRFFFVIMTMKYRWIISFRCHFILIGTHWILPIVLSLPAILTKDIVFSPHYLCWVSLSYSLHAIYTFTVYYGVPTALVFFIYAYVYYRTKYTAARLSQRRRSIRQQDRNYIVFRNIIILFGIYLLGGVPSTIYIFTSISIFYSIGIVSMSFAVAIKSLVTLFLDRELFIVLKAHFRQKAIRVIPFVFRIS